jgi:hypothetical protein
MEQRPLRLGDIVDDYCPRERRITNHAIVAIVEDAIRQTRCSTCDTEHVYKHAREPLRRRKDAPAAEPAVGARAAPAETAETTASAPASAVGSVAEPDVETALSAAESSAASPTPDLPGAPHEDGWLAHRRLIRASLPKVEGEPQTPRPIPEFTMHQRPVGRGGHAFRFARGGHGHGNGSGNAARRGDSSHGRGQPGERNGNQAPGDGGRRRDRGHGKRSR